MRPFGPGPLGATSCRYGARTHCDPLADPTLIRTALEPQNGTLRLHKSDLGSQLQQSLRLSLPTDPEAPCVIFRHGTVSLLLDWVCVMPFHPCIII